MDEFNAGAPLPTFGYFLWPPIGDTLSSTRYGSTLRAGLLLCWGEWVREFWNDFPKLSLFLELLFLFFLLLIEFYKWGTRPGTTWGKTSYVFVLYAGWCSSNPYESSSYAVLECCTSPMISAGSPSPLYSESPSSYPTSNSYSPYEFWSISAGESPCISKKVLLWLYSPSGMWLSIIGSMPKAAALGYDASS